MDSQILVSKAIAWMRPRKWREKLAKSRSGQSLFEHSLIELDAFLTMAPIFRDPKHYELTDLEVNILTVALIVHDAGKETDAWQRYVNENKTSSYVSHIIPELSAELAPGICRALDLEDLSAQVHKVIVNCAGMHHDRPGRSNGAIIEAILTDVTDRFVTLSNLVKAIDHLCSAETPSDAASTAQRDPCLQKHIKITIHELIPRGFSTTLLHRSAQSAFLGGNWQPLLYFPTGTVYFADLNKETTIPTSEAICSALKGEIQTALQRDVADLMIGSPTANMLPKPHLVSFAEVREYFVAAGRKVGPQSFARKKPEERRRVVATYLQKRNGEAVTDSELERNSGRISTAHPEMVVFKFFKALLDPAKVPAVGANGAILAAQKYDSVFGAGAWQQLQSTSTLSAAKDMANSVDHFWRLRGSQVSHPEVPTVEELPQQTRLDVLIDTLSQIACSVFETLDRPSPRDALAGDMAQSFIADLLTPTLQEDIKAYASNQLRHYRASKPWAGKKSGSGQYLCPICSKPFETAAGIMASADFIDNPQTHTNRGVSHGSFGYVMVCSTCYYERMLRQLLVGDNPAEIIALSPRLNLGPLNGELLLSSIRQWADTANATKGVEFGFSMSFTDQTARSVQERDPFELESNDLVAMFRYRYSTDTQKKRSKEALRMLKDEFEDDLNSLNIACSAAYTDWDAALESLWADKIDQQDCKRIRREVFKLGDAVTLIPQTPNLILIPLNYEITSGKDESESNKALRRLFVALILSAVFDSAVSINRSSEIPDFSHRTGAAEVPAVAAVRSLIGKEWVPVSQAKHWIRAIGAASILAHDAELPARSALYQVLVADPPEALARRIEVRNAAGRVSLEQLRLIEQLPAFRSYQPDEAHK